MNCVADTLCYALLLCQMEFASGRVDRSTGERVKIEPPQPVYEYQ